MMGLHGFLLVEALLGAQKGAQAGWFGQGVRAQGNVTVD